MKEEQLIGTYFTLKFRTKVEAHSYKLWLTQKDPNEVLKFKLLHTVSGHYGSLGSEWLGVGYLTNQILTLIIWIRKRFFIFPG